MIRDQDIPDEGFEDMVLYQNIRRSRITKGATRPKLFLVQKLFGGFYHKQIPHQESFMTPKGKAFATFHPTHIAAAYKLPPPQVMMTEDWIKGINIDPLEYAKKMIVLGKQLRQKASEEYECQSLRTPFRIIDLLLSRIFGREDGTIYKLN